MKMSAAFRRTLLALVLVLVLITTGAWQSDPVALAARQATGLPDAPLYPGLTWSSLGSSTQTIRVDIQGDSISLAGERYKASQQFASELPQDLLDYYSNEQLAKSGWVSYDAYTRADETHYVFYHDSGVYFSVEYFSCPADPASLCVTIWKSEPTPPAQTTADPFAALSPSASGAFGKTSPLNGTTGLNPASVTLTWGASSGAVKYGYCIVQAGSACTTNWTSSYDRSVTVTNLAFDKTYSWQIRATSCENCVPKPWVYANGGTSWTFKTKSASQVSILGNAGITSAILSYTDGTARTVQADSSGAYSIKVPYKWSGTVTPSKAGYIFSPASASFTNLTAAQTIQNFAASPLYVISGNTGLAGVTLSATSGSSVVSDVSGNYALGVPAGWSGTVTPSKAGYAFSPASRPYANVVANLTGQNYTPIPVYSISGNAGVAGATLSYTDTAPRTVTSQANGSYLLFVPANWIGTVTVTHPCFTFSPPSRSYNTLPGNLTGQDYTAALNNSSGCAEINVSVGGANQGKFGVASHAGTRTGFVGISNGPLKIAISNAVPVIGAERVIYNVNNTPTSFSEMMALPAGQLDNLYWLPWYNDLDLDTQLRIANVTTQTATVHLSIGGHEMLTGCTPSSSPYTLAAGESIRINCLGVSAGPVKIDSNQNIVAAEREIYRVNKIPNSFTETMALPNGQLDNLYWLPWYNDLDLDTQLRIANVTTQTATVHLSIGGQEMLNGCTPSSSPYTLGPGESIRVSCPGVSAGPVKIESTQNIVAAERVIYRVNNTPTSFSETLALPNSQLNTTYWLPWYNNVDLDTQLRIANVTTQTATVHVFINGQEKTSGCAPSSSPYTLAAGESIRITCAGVNNGLVKIQSNQNIVATERVIYRVNNIPTSFTEMLGLPNSQLNATHWLPWYNNVDLDTQLRFGLP